MSGSLILWMTLALSIFWGVGLYNRLMRMRARGLGALGSVEKHVRQYAELVQEHGLGSEAVPARAAAAADRPAGRWAQLQADLQARWARRPCKPAGRPSPCGLSRRAAGSTRY